VLAALAVVLALQQQPVVLDTAVYAAATWRVSLPRPFDDWVFAPAAARGTATIIFQPRSGQLSDQLWGALVLTHWGGPVPLDSVVERRVRTTWRVQLGPSFALLARDSFDVAGYPAVHLVMTGSIERAVLDVEEFLIARDNDLVVLQLRYPRGVPREPMTAGYRRVVEGLRLGGAARAGSSARPGPPTGRYRLESRRVGRLTVGIRREESRAASITRVDDDMVALIARAWRIYWHDFGPLPAAEVTLVETARAATHGAGATIYVGADASPAVLARELSRAWWGGAVRADAPDTALIESALPAMAAELVTGDSSLNAASEAARVLALARRAAGEARFRAAIRTLVVESRNNAAATDAFLTALGPQAAAFARQLIQQQ
jgi:hypothetical protein